MAAGVAQVPVEQMQAESKEEFNELLQTYQQTAKAKTDLEQSYAVGKAAVEYAVKGMNSVMPTIVRVSSKPYRWKIGVAKLSDVANVEKKMPRDFITADGFHITQKCRNYLAPLIVGEAPPKFENGLPRYVRLKNAAVKKKTPAFTL
jgi:6-phosphofructokinase 1